MWLELSYMRQYGTEFNVAKDDATNEEMDDFVSDLELAPC